jgi:hypothetical protein
MALFLCSWESISRILTITSGGGVAGGDPFLAASGSNITTLRGGVGRIGLAPVAAAPSPISAAPFTGVRWLLGGVGGFGGVDVVVVGDVGSWGRVVDDGDCVSNLDVVGRRGVVVVVVVVCPSMDEWNGWCLIPLFS